jgi:hypothetical protein
MQLLHGVCCFDFISNIALSPAALPSRWGVGKLTSPLSANANALPVTFRPPIMTLACYQQAGGGGAESSGKSLAFVGKRIP